MHHLVTVILQVEEHRHRSYNMLWESAGENADGVLEDLFYGLHFIVGDPQLALEVVLRVLNCWHGRALGKSGALPDSRHVKGSQLSGVPMWLLRHEGRCQCREQVVNSSLPLLLLGQCPLSAADGSSGMDDTRWA